MSLPPAPLPALAAMSTIAINPLEHAFMAVNTNPYFIGLMMLLLNLGGRFLGMEISKEQERVFQNPWVRRGLVFTVLFVATRNVFVAGIMTIFVLILLSFLLNENSELCLWKDSCGSQPTDDVQLSPGLTPEETEIWRRLNEKQMRIAASAQTKKKESTEEILSVDNIYAANLAKLQN
jgi:hypothetical protein